MLFVNALSEDILIKNLNPEKIYAGDTEGNCTGLTASCLSVTYRDPNDFNYKTDFFGGDVGFDEIITSVPSGISTTCTTSLSLPSTVETDNSN